MNFINLNVFEEYKQNRKQIEEISKYIINTLGKFYHRDKNLKKTFSILYYANPRYNRFLMDDDFKFVYIYYSGENSVWRCKKLTVPIEVFSSKEKLNIFLFNKIRIYRNYRVKTVINNS